MEYLFIYLFCHDFHLSRFEKPNLYLTVEPRSVHAYTYHPSYFCLYIQLTLSALAEMSDQESMLLLRYNDYAYMYNYMYGYTYNI